MYRGQEYGGSGGGGEMPSCYDDLTELLENEVLTADTTNNVLRGNFEGELKLGYIQDAYKIDENGDPVVWGDTEQTGLTGAIGSMCDRIADLEEGGGSLPAYYSELTEVLENGDLRFNVDPNYVSMNLTGYHMRLDVSGGHIYHSGNWGDTHEPELDVAIGSMCSRIANLEESGGGGGEMPAVYDDLTTMLNRNNIDMSLNESGGDVTLEYVTMNLTGYSSIVVGDNNTDCDIKLVSPNTWGDTGQDGLIAAITSICDRISNLESTVFNQ